MKTPKRALILAPHPDDEVLGVGATMARFATEGSEVYVAIVTKGQPPYFDAKDIETGREEAQIAHKRLGVKETFYLDFPAAGLDTVPHREVNAKLSELLRRVRPETLFIPFEGDIHRDHQLVSLSALVAARPRSFEAPSTILAYETLSETNWNGPGAPRFVPNVFVGASPTALEAKLEAFACFKSQVKPFPDERSLEALRALAQLRGAAVHVPAAEAFMLVRQILR